MSQRLAHALWMPREHTTSLERKSSLQPGASCIWGSPPKACTAGQQGGPQLRDVCANPQQWKQLDSWADVSRVGCHSVLGALLPSDFSILHSSPHVPASCSPPPPASPGYHHFFREGRGWGRKNRTLDREYGDLGLATALLCDL